MNESAIEDRQIGPPRPDRVPVLLGHDSRRLGNVAEVVRHPGGEQLPQGDRAQRRVLPFQRQFTLGQPPAAQRLHHPFVDRCPPV